jgi:hypothetical protein
MRIKKVEEFWKPNQGIKSDGKKPPRLMPAVGPRHIYALEQITKN